MVDAVNEGGAMVSCMVQATCINKANWMYPETSATCYTPRDQIIAIDLSVVYSCVSIIRCKINAKTVFKLDELFSEYIKKYDLTSVVISKYVNCVFCINRLNLYNFDPF